MRKRIRPRPLWVVSALLIAITAYLLGWSNVFQVTTYTVNGIPAKATAIITSQIEQSQLVLRGKPLARVDSRVVARTLSANSWVSIVHVTRHWLSGEIEISITMKTPIAELLGGENSYLTSDGEITRFPDALTGDLPTITGRYLGQAGAQLANSLLVDLNQALNSQLQIKSVVINSPTSISTAASFIDRALTIQWGDGKEIPLKLKVLQGLLALPENSNVQRIDLSAPMSPIVK